MSIEELKLILETVEGLGQETKEVVVWYLVLQLGKHLSIMALSVFGIVIGARVLKHLVECVNGIDSLYNLLGVKYEYGKSKYGSLYSHVKKMYDAQDS